MLHVIKICYQQDVLTKLRCMCNVYKAPVGDRRADRNNRRTNDCVNRLQKKQQQKGNYKIRSERSLVKLYMYWGNKVHVYKKTLSNE